MKKIFFFIATLAIGLSLGALFPLEREAEVFVPEVRVVHLPVTAASKKVALGPPLSMFRGSPARTGIQPEARLDPDLKEAWNVKLNEGIHDASKASPAVDGTGIYVGSDAGWFTAFDFDGRVRWRQHVENSPEGIHATAALDGVNAYVGAYNGVFYAFNKKDGAVAWTYHLGAAFGSSALIDEDYLYVAVETIAPLNGNVVKLRRRDGFLMWRSPFLGDQAHASPTLDKASKLLFVGSNDGSFTAIRQGDGAVAWRIGLGRPVKSTAALVEGVLYFTSWAGKMHAIEAKTGKTVWEKDLHPGFVPHSSPSSDAKGAALTLYDMSSPTYVPDWDLFVVGTREGHVQGIRRRNGEVAWKIPTEWNWMLASALVTPSADAERKWDVWMLCRSNVLCLLDPRYGGRISEISLRENYSGMPVAFDGSLYVAMDYAGGLSRFKPER